MRTVFRQDKLNHIQRAVESMAKKIKTILTLSADSPAKHKKILRLTIEVPDQPLLPWLMNQKSSLKIYWSDRQDKFEMAGVGAADYVGDGDEYGYYELFRRLHGYLDNSGDRVRYYGGFNFGSNQEADDGWKRFGRYFFILPRFELVKSANKAFFVCNLLTDVDGYHYRPIMSQLEAISFENGNISHDIPKIISEKDFPKKNRWIEIVQSALAACDAQQYEKIVLARKTVLELSESLNCLVILHNLKEEVSNSYKFCFQPEDNLAFIGASPELLYYREGKKIRCEAVAGTRPRGRTKEEDQRYSAELLRSEKDLREHRYVIHSIEDAFKPLARSVLNCNPTSTSLLKLSRIQHLITPFEFELKENVSDAELIGALHPTAAVGGYPKDKTIGEIMRLEGFNRGWYAAPVGWVGRDAAEFVVAIRSGLVKGNFLSLYSGAGIINGSVPENEWDEMNYKIEMFLRVFT
ncbi:MAG: isochorismate synthase [Pseudomonadota bacterium]|uniref:Isochorismate synthase MenF n=1 Tax=Candidatus Desulfatibia profunda TaxID=2841695 RepID=A0A8J6NP98_9BACT|nr:isochorismate synthase [Candidatus Desulfatibia profunda]MBL7180879.1 isochorismate synthase [Desulfobacterales bacterium]